MARELAEYGFIIVRVHEVQNLNLANLCLVSGYTNGNSLFYLNNQLSTEVSVASPMTAPACICFRLPRQRMFVFLPSKEAEMRLWGQKILNYFQSDRLRKGGKISPLSHLRECGRKVDEHPGRNGPKRKLKMRKYK